MGPHGKAIFIDGLSAHRVRDLQRVAGTAQRMEFQAGLSFRIYDELRDRQSFCVKSVSVFLFL